MYHLYGVHHPGYHGYNPESDITRFRHGLDRLVDIAQDFRVTSAGRIMFHVECFNAGFTSHPVWSDWLEKIGPQSCLPRHVERPSFTIRAYIQPLFATRSMHTFSQTRPISEVCFQFPSYTPHAGLYGGHPGYGSVGHIEHHRVASGYGAGHLGGYVRHGGGFDYQHVSIDMVVFSMANEIAKTYGVHSWNNIGQHYGLGANYQTVGVDSFPDWSTLQSGYHNYYQGQYANTPHNRHPLYSGYHGAGFSPPQTVPNLDLNGDLRTFYGHLNRHLLQQMHGSFPALSNVGASNWNFGAQMFGGGTPTVASGYGMHPVPNAYNIPNQMHTGMPHYPVSHSPYSPIPSVY